MRLSTLAADLARLHGPDCEVEGLALDSRRVRPGDLFAALPGSRADGLAFAELPHLRFEAIAADRVGEVLAAALGPRAGKLAPLLADVADLARLYARATGSAPIRLRLEAIRDDACRRFHADQVHARLLCTYRGPATEWLAARDVRLAADGYVADPEPGAIRRLERFEVGLFAGALSPRSWVHRSRPLSGSGRDRLLLVVDEGGEAAGCNC